MSKTSHRYAIHRYSSIQMFSPWFNSNNNRFLLVKVMLEKRTSEFYASEKRKMKNNHLYLIYLNRIQLQSIFFFSVLLESLFRRKYI